MRDDERLELARAWWELESRSPDVTEEDLVTFARLDDELGSEESAAALIREVVLLAPDGYGLDYIGTSLVEDAIHLGVPSIDSLLRRTGLPEDTRRKIRSGILPSLFDENG